MFSNQANINELLQICSKAEPAELSLAQLLLTNIDANTKLGSRQTPVLAQIIQNFSKYSIANTFMLPEYIRLFLSQGFDCPANGAACLHALLESVSDENLLTAADLLIAAGTIITPMKLEEILKDISEIAAYHEFQTHNYYLQNLFFAYRQLLLNTFTPINPRYLTISHYTTALQQKLRNICFNSLEPLPKHLYFNFTNGTLIVQNHPNIFMCSTIEKTLTPPAHLNLQISPVLTSLLKDQSLESVSFSYHKLENSQTIQYFPIIHLNFSKNHLTITRSQSSGSLQTAIDGEII